jgi:hypothetical protein
MLVVFFWLLICKIEVQPDSYLIEAYAKAVASKSQAEKFQILSLALERIRRGQYSRRCADSIGLLYASLLIQDMPKSINLSVCDRLSEMEGLKSSVDGIISFAKMFRTEAVSRPRVNRMRMDRLHRILEDVEVVDSLIRTLKRTKGPDVSDMQGGFRSLGDNRPVPR